MNALLIVLCALCCNLFLCSATYIRPQDKKQPEKQVADEPAVNDFHALYAEYQPEIDRILMNPRLLQDLYEAVQYQQQNQRPEEVEAPEKRAQTFVRFGKRSADKRAQTFVRFGKRAQTFVRFGR